VADQDPSERFDYLFEPLDGETTTATEVPVVESVVAAETAHRARRWWPLPVIAVVVALIGVVVLILWRPGPVDVAPSVDSSATQSTPTPIVTSAPVIEAPPELTPAPVPPPEETTTVVPEPAPVPVPAPSPPPSRPDTRQAPTPTLRPPISVSPEPRPAFPNQHPPDGDQGRGGLLPGLGGLL
jgi:hypothetical protein